MVDHFADRYWPPGYYPTGYFQGGEQNPGAMSANLSGGGAVSAALTAPAVVSVSAGGGKKKARKSRRPLSWPVIRIPEPVPAFMSAALAGSSKCGAKPGAAAVMAASIGGASSVEATGTVQRSRRLVETEFWLMAA